MLKGGDGKSGLSAKVPGMTIRKVDAEEAFELLELPVAGREHSGH